MPPAAPTTMGGYDPYSEGMERKLALITGGTRGIGAAIAAELASTHELIIGGTNAERVEEAVAKYPHARPFVCDLLDVEAIADAVAALNLDSLDVAVLSAGTSARGKIAEVEPEVWTRTLTLNVTSVAETIRQLLPALRAAKGQVIAINSGSGYTSKAGNAVYSASKFALRALTDALREEERGKVRVSSIHPGRVDTDMQVQIQKEAGHGYEPTDHVAPESVAKAVRAVVDTSAEATIENLEIRPVVKTPTA